MPQPASSPVPSPRPPASRARLLILGLLTIGTMTNYLDRTVISVAAPSMSHELGLDAVILGLVFSAFSWTYAAAQIPGGILLDRVGVRITYFLALAFWSGFTLLQGVAAGLKSLLGLRLALGIAEAPCFPSNSRVLATWFPQRERARATGVYSIGQYAGLAFLSPLLYWMAAELGWRMLFILVGAFGLLFSALWWWQYQEPDRHPRANRAELELIAAGGGLARHIEGARFSWSHIGFLMRQRQVVGASLGQFCSNSTQVFFLTWFPTYLASERHLDWIKAGFFAVLPFIAALIGVLFGGILSDQLLKSTGSANIARKLPVVSGLLLCSCIVLANFVDSNALVIVAMSVAFFGQGMTNLGWTLLTDVAPHKLFGTTGGFFNFCANLAGIVTPLVVGILYETTGSFAWALAYIAVLAIVGVLSYLLIIGDVRRVEYAGE